MRKRLLTIALGLLPAGVSMLYIATSTSALAAESEASPRPTIELRWTTSLVGTVLTNPVRFPTHRGFVVLHVSEHQGDNKNPGPFTLAVAPHCVELARKTTNDEVIITPFDDGTCVLTVSDQAGNVATEQLYVGPQAITAESSPSPAPSATPSPVPTAR